MCKEFQITKMKTSLKNTNIGRKPSNSSFSRWVRVYIPYLNKGIQVCKIIALCNKGIILTIQSDGTSYKATKTQTLIIVYKYNNKFNILPLNNLQIANKSNDEINDAIEYYIKGLQDCYNKIYPENNIIIKQLFRIQLLDGGNNESINWIKAKLNCALHLSDLMAGATKMYSKKKYQSLKIINPFEIDNTISGIFFGKRNSISNPYTHYIEQNNDIDLRSVYGTKIICRNQNNFSRLCYIPYIIIQLNGAYYDFLASNELTLKIVKLFDEKVKGLTFILMGVLQYNNSYGPMKPLFNSQTDAYSGYIGILQIKHFLYELQKEALYSWQKIYFLFGINDIYGKNTCVFNSAEPYYLISPVIFNSEIQLSDSLLSTIYNNFIRSFANSLILQDRRGSISMLKQLLQVPLKSIIKGNKLFFCLTTIIQKYELSISQCLYHIKLAITYLNECIPLWYSKFDDIGWTCKEQLPLWLKHTNFTNCMNELGNGFYNNYQRLNRFLDHDVAVNKATWEWLLKDINNLKQLDISKNDLIRCIDAIDIKNELLKQKHHQNLYRRNIYNKMKESKKKIIHKSNKYHVQFQFNMVWITNELNKIDNQENKMKQLRKYKMFIKHTWLNKQIFDKKKKRLFKKYLHVQKITYDKHISDLTQIIKLFNG